MDSDIGVAKTISLTSRDFYAESWEKDGTAFHVSPMATKQTAPMVEAWWLKHRFDNYRSAFKADDGEYHLECHDETEALSLVLNLQREFNRSLPT